VQQAQAVNTQDGNPGNLADNYGALGTEYKWENQADLMLNAQ